jgi:hypothetical protein
MAAAGNYSGDKNAKFQTVIIISYSSHFQMWYLKTSITTAVYGTHFKDMLGI